VLDVQRGINVDPGLQQFVHILPPLQVTGTRGIRMSQFIDKDQGGISFQRGIDIEFGKIDPFVGNYFSREEFQAFEERFGFGSLVSFDIPGYNIQAFFFAMARGLQHGIGFSDTGHGAEKDLELAAPGFFSLRPF
jgi:hypothetical protein